jgi:hypothetical protein
MDGAGTGSTARTIVALGSDIAAAGPGFVRGIVAAVLRQDVAQRLTVAAAHQPAVASAGPMQRQAEGMQWLQDTRRAADTPWQRVAALAADMPVGAAVMAAAVMAAAVTDTEPPFAGLSAGSAMRHIPRPPGNRRPIALRRGVDRASLRRHALGNPSSSRPTSCRIALRRRPQRVGVYGVCAFRSLESDAGQEGPVMPRLRRVALRPRPRGDTPSFLACP